MSTTRTFIAVPAQDEVYAQALATINALRPLADNVRWTLPDNLHWTLQFLGEVTDVDIYQICREVGRVAQQFEPFQLQARMVSAFPSLDKPRTIWLGAGQGSKVLCELQERVQERMADLRFRPESRRFTPQLTIGRVQQGVHGGQQLSDKLATMVDFDGGQMEVDEVIVYGSELTREGPTYHVLGRAPLAE